MQSKQSLTPRVNVSVEKICQFILSHRRKRAWAEMTGSQITVNIICAIARGEIIVVQNDAGELEGVAIGRADHLNRVAMCDNWLATTRQPGRVPYIE